jgi:hypothetical protein
MGYRERGRPIRLARIRFAQSAEHRPIRIWIFAAAIFPGCSGGFLGVAQGAQSYADVEMMDGSTIPRCRVWLLRSSPRASRETWRLFATHLRHQGSVGAPVQARSPDEETASLRSRNPGRRWSDENPCALACGEAGPGLRKREKRLLYPGYALLRSSPRTACSAALTASRNQYVITDTYDFLMRSTHAGAI